MGESIGSYVDRYSQRYRVKYVEILVSLGLSIHNSTWNDANHEIRVPKDSPYMMHSYLNYIFILSSHTMSELTLFIFPSFIDKVM